MKRGLIIGLVVVVALVLIFGGWIRGTYNTLVQRDEQVSESWAQVENQLQRRFDLIPNLVETVKGYAAHERETLTAVTEARARVAGASTRNEQIEANEQLGSALSRLLVVVEQYPNLKADQTFIRLQDELSGTENRISVERRRYNETVRDYNVQVRTFPANLIAGMFGFDRAEMFEAAEGADQVPRVDFSGEGAGS